MIFDLSTDVRIYLAFPKYIINIEAKRQPLVLRMLFLSLGQEKKNAAKLFFNSNFGCDSSSGVRIVQQEDDQRHIDKGAALVQYF